MHAIRLDNTEFEGGNAVYLLGTDEDGPTTLVDAGTGGEAIRADLVAGLADAGVSLADVDQVLLTHFHGDHAGAAGAVQDASGAVVRVHEADAALVERDETARAAFEERHEALYEQWGMPERARAALRERISGDTVWSDVDASVEPFEEGDRFPVGAGEVAVLHLPGHTAGQCGFVLEQDDRRVLFSGDALLPKYTPNVGGADVRVEAALRRYLDSLVAVVEGEFDVAYPGHRDPIQDPAARAREILAHHRSRTERVVGVLADHGPSDAWTVSAHLFGDLEGIHILHGPGEAYAHLEHLREADLVARTDGEYSLAEPDPELDPLFPSPD